MIAWLTEPWAYPFMRWALVCCLVLAGIHAYLGFHVVRRGILFVDLAMAQTAALGAACAIVLGFEHGTAREYAMSFGFALAAAGLFSIVRSRRIHAEAWIAIFYAMASAATFVVLEHSPHGMEEVKHLFVGQVLTVAPHKILLTAGLYGVIGFMHWKLHPKTLAISEVQDIPGRRLLDFFFYASFAAIVTSSVGLVGVLLVFSFLVLPAVAAMLLAQGDAARLAWGWLFAGAGSLAGLHAAFHWDLPAAPVIALTLGAILAIAAFASRVLSRSQAGSG
jgi:zinc/manganese transport system permease protein